MDEREVETSLSHHAEYSKTSPTPNPGSTSGGTLPRTYSLERKGLQKYVNVPSEATQQQSGTSSAGIAHLQGLQPPASSDASPSPGNGAVKGGIATTSTGLAALARAGKLFNTNSVFDLEVLIEHLVYLDRI